MLGGLTLSLYLIHLLPIAMTNAMMLLACAGLDAAVSAHAAVPKAQNLARRQRRRA
jgi:hypothetical protein